MPAVAMGPDRLLRPLSELDTWGGRLIDVVPSDARCASARSLDTNLPGLVLYEESSPRLFDTPPGSGSRLLWAEGGRTGDIGGVFQAARTSSGGWQGMEMKVKLNGGRKKRERKRLLNTFTVKIPRISPPRPPMTSNNISSLHKIWPGLYLVCYVL